MKIAAFCASKKGFFVGSKIKQDMMKRSSIGQWCRTPAITTRPFCANPVSNTLELRAGFELTSLFNVRPLLK